MLPMLRRSEQVLLITRSDKMAPIWVRRQHKRHAGAKDDRRGSPSKCPRRGWRSSRRKNAAPSEAGEPFDHPMNEAKRQSHYGAVRMERRKQQHSIGPRNVL